MKLPDIRNSSPERKTWEDQSATGQSEATVSVVNKLFENSWGRVGWYEKKTLRGGDDVVVEKDSLTWREISSDRRA